MKQAIAGEAVRMQVGHAPKYYQGTLSIGRKFHILRRQFRTATAAQAYAQHFAEWWNKRYAETD